MIYIYPEGGLCNRMRAIDSALALARESGQPLVIIWALNTDLNCDFHLLFKALPDFVRIYTVNHLGLTGRLRRYFIAAGCWLTGKTYLKQSRLIKLAAKPDDLRQLAVQGRLYIKTHSRFWHGKQDYQDFAPAAELANKIAAQILPDQHTVAVHIRRTDNADAITHSPLTLFIEYMQQEQQQNPQTLFFVATDDPQVLNGLQNQFGQAVLFHPKASYLRSDPAAIQDALVDLYCLARCRKLLGSYWSSFTDTAGELFHIPVVIVKIPQK